MADRWEYERVAQEALPVLYKIAMGILRSDADARDAVQQALLKGWEKKENAREGMFRWYLTRILINECRNIQRSRQRSGHLGAFCRRHGPADHDVASVGKRAAAYALPGAAAHNHGGIQRGPLEIFEVGADVPGHIAGAADGQIVADRHNNVYHSYTATGAFIAGHGS